MRKNKYNYILFSQIEKVIKVVRVAILLRKKQRREKDNMNCERQVNLIGL